MRFDQPNDPSPLDAATAVWRGNLIINWPVRALLLSGFGSAYFLSEVSITLAGIAMVFGFFGAWAWWSYFVPAWRDWALERGADLDELQALGVRANLLWPKGSIFERTEFRRNRR